MWTSTKNITMALFLAFSLSACFQKKSGGAGRSNPAYTGGPLNTTQCASANEAIGRVYETNTGSSATFEQRVKGLIAATNDPQYFGVISGSAQNSQNGVTIEGRLHFDATTGAVHLDQTNLQLTIYDDFVGRTDESGNVVQPFTINFDRAASGSVNVSTQQFTLQFSDQYGSVSLTGQISGGTVTGTITYQNTTNFDGSAGYGGTLGGFSISTCGWLN